MHVGDSRNFRQHVAITAGLEHSRGEWIVVMDCDLQDRPEEIPVLHAYAFLSYMTETPQDSAVANFGIYRRPVIEAVVAARESHHYFPLRVRSVGFRKGLLDVVHAERESGKSSYNMRRMANLAVDNILSYSDKPLRLTVRLGWMIVLLTIIVGLAILCLSLSGSITVANWASIVFAQFLLSGLIIELSPKIGGDGKEEA